MFALLGYMFQNIGLSNYTFLLPPIILTPIVTMVDQNKIENIPDNDLKFNKIDVLNDFLNDKDSFRQSLNRGSFNIKTKLNEDKFRENTEELDKVSDVNSTATQTEVIATANGTNATSNNIVSSTTETSEELPLKNNATESISNEIILPTDDDRWKNFSMTANTTSTEIAVTNESSSTNKGPYSAALYNNAMIDELSITTNSYTNESPLLLPKDDRWRTFSVKKAPVNGFKPLAGLYYDGFLHKPLLMLPGFVPRKRDNVFK